MSENTKVVTGLVRLSYANLFEPRSIEGSAPKYSVSLIIPKSDKKTVAKIKKAVDTAIEEGKESTFKGKKVTKASLKLPLRDGDAERPEDEAYADSYFVNANSSEKYRPIVLDKRKQVVDDEQEVYSGCYAFASIEFYAFNVSGNRGVACGLRGIQKIKDGEPLGGVINAIDDFDEVDDEFDEEDEDFLN